MVELEKFEDSRLSPRSVIALHRRQFRPLFGRLVRTISTSLYSNFGPYIHIPPATSISR